MPRAFSTRHRYFPRTAAVWYEGIEIPGGTLGELRRREALSPSDYVFDQTSADRLYLLMPELQAHRRTVLVWRGPPAAAETRNAAGTSPLAADRFVADALAGPAGAVRLALQVEGLPGESAALGYDLRVPSGADLALGFVARLGCGFGCGGLARMACVSICWTSKRPVRMRGASGALICQRSGRQKGGCGSKWKVRAPPTGPIRGLCTTEWSRRTASNRAVNNRAANNRAVNAARRRLTTLGASG